MVENTSPQKEITICQKYRNKKKHHITAESRQSAKIADIIAIIK
jgi:hypothetical protein